MELDIDKLAIGVLRARERLHLEQEEVAQRAKMSRAYISRLERGLVPNPKIGDLMAVAKALRTSVEALVYPSNPLTEDEEQQLAHLMAQPDLRVHFATIAKSYEEFDDEDRRALLESLQQIAKISGFKRGKES